MPKPAGRSKESGLPAVPKTKCGANTKQGRPCKNPAGLRTSHPGTGKCHKHGGASDGAPIGNKNAVVTGEYETLHVSALDAGERHLYEAAEMRPTSQAENTLRLLCVREHRILLRIGAAVEAELDSDNGLFISSVSNLDGFQPKGRVNTQQVDRAPVLETVLRLEDALTRVTALKLRAVAMLRECLKDQTDEGNPLDALVEAINRKGREIAEEEAREEE